MSEKNVNSRIVHKHDTAENWAKATNFVPREGEIIIYDKDSEYTFQRMKIGDGVTKVNALPFISANTDGEGNIITETYVNVSDVITTAEIEEICGGSLETYLESIAAEEVGF